jgi:nitrogen regulatory protein PII
MIITIKIKLGPPHYHLKLESEQQDHPPLILQLQEEEKNNSMDLARKGLKHLSAQKNFAVLTAIGSLKLAATYYDSKGKGKGQKYTISYGRGVGSSKMAYSDRKTVVTIVDEHRVEDVITTIRSAAGEKGSSSAGIIVISSVDDILQI